MTCLALTTVTALRRPSAAVAGLSSQRPLGLMVHPLACTVQGLAVVSMVAFVNAAPPGAAVG